MDIIESTQRVKDKMEGKRAVFQEFIFLEKQHTTISFNISNLINLIIQYSNSMKSFKFVTRKHRQPTHAEPNIKCCLAVTGGHIYQQKMHEFGFKQSPVQLLRTQENNVVSLETEIQSDKMSEWYSIRVQMSEYQESGEQNNFYWQQENNQSTQFDYNFTQVCQDL